MIPQKDEPFFFEIEDFDFANTSDVSVYKSKDLPDNHKYRVVYFEENETVDG